MLKKKRTKAEVVFVQKVRRYYRRHGRQHLPWRETTDPYRIWVSEIMLQQTQVDRVIPKYEAFIEQFPDARALARASLGDVLKCWQGLGYNRRAKLLHQCAKAVVKTHRSEFPHTRETLEALPGIGPYTAGAILAFAFNTPTPLIETNIRTVYLHHFFGGKENVTDADILKRVERTSDRKNPREWYAALMDYGSYLKKVHGNPNTRSRHYTKQSRFAGSDRQIRGAILRALSGDSLRMAKLEQRCAFEPARIEEQAAVLVREGLISVQKGRYSLPA